MTNILLESPLIGEAWIFDSLRPYLLPHYKVTIIALSFSDAQVSSPEMWEACYGKEKGQFYVDIVNGLLAYGIAEENISFLHVYDDTKEEMCRKIREADVIYYLGGYPDLMYERIVSLGLYDALLSHKGVIMGYSAGAVIQLAEYHLSPDHDYPAFGYYKGVPYLSDFYLEVHYDGTEAQDNCIRRVLRERGKTCYAARHDQGALIVQDGEVTLVGKVLTFCP